MPKQCSELFERIFDSGCGGCVRTCGCGITHFDSQSPHHYDNEDELRSLQRLAKDDPTMYVEHGGSIGTMSITGAEIVIGCTCDIARRYEGLIRNHAHQLAQYLNEYAVQLRNAAEAMEVKEPIEGR